MNSFSKILAGALLAAGVAGAAQAAPDPYPNPGVEASSSTFFAAANGRLVAYFAGSDAGYDQYIGAIINGVMSPVTGLANHSTAYGTRLDFGSILAGQSIVFLDHIVSTGEVWSSLPGSNSDGANHAYTNIFNGDGFIPAGFALHFEDIAKNAGSDLDYNDMVIVIGVEPGGAVPEPATWALMIAGFGLAGGALRRRRAITA